MSISPYRDFIFEAEALAALRRLGLSEQLIAEIIRNPLRTEKDDAGRVVSVQRDHSTGAHLFIHHQPVREDQGPGVPGILDTQIATVRLESDEGISIG